MDQETQIKNPCILLTGAAYSEHKGSAAMLMAMIDSFNATFRNPTFLFCSFTPDIDCRQSIASNVFVIPYSFRIRSLEFIISAIYLKLSKNHPPHNISIIKAISNADFILDLSGDTFSSEYGTVSILSLGARIISAKILGKPTILYCQSIGPFKGFVDRNLAKFFLKLSDLTIVREYITANNLHSIGIDVPVCADQAFLLKPATVSVDFVLPDKPIIGINLSQYIDAFYAGDHPSNKYRLIMAQFIDALIERYNSHILIIPEVKKQDPNSYDDYYVSKKIISMLKHGQDVTLIEGDHTSSELKTLTGYCDILISPRFHMVIFALSQHVPSIAIAYIPKAYGIMAMMGQSDFVINYKDLNIDLLMSKVSDLWGKKEIVRLELCKKMPEMRLRANCARKMVVKLLSDKKKKLNLID